MAPLGTPPLLLALLPLLSLLAGAVGAPVACPIKGDFTIRSANINISDPRALAHGFHFASNIDTVPSAAACGALAAKYVCGPYYTAPAGFFVYLEEPVSIPNPFLLFPPPPPPSPPPL